MCPPELPVFIDNQLPNRTNPQAHQYDAWVYNKRLAGESGACPYLDLPAREGFLVTKLIPIDIRKETYIRGFRESTWPVENRTMLAVLYDINGEYAGFWFMPGSTVRSYVYDRTVSSAVSYDKGARYIALTVRKQDWQYCLCKQGDTVLFDGSQHPPRQ